MALDITPDDVLRAAGGKCTPWFASPKPPLPSLSLGEEGWAAFKRARERRYLVLPTTLNRNVAAVWGWWCHACKQPEAVIRADPMVHGWTARFDLSPAGLRFTPTALIPIGQAFRATHREEEDWVVTPDTCELDGLDPDTAAELIDALWKVVGHPRCVRRVSSNGAPDSA